jgi:HD-like signal output (HDOD) protein/FixJ family two-component response regulator
MPRILIVDDMAVIREPIAAMLRENQFETVTASNGQEALARIAQSRPDIILLDVSMPVMDGLAVLRELATRFPTTRIPVILLTGESDRKQILEAASLGVKDYLLKTHFSMPDLLRRARRLLAIDETLKTGEATPAAKDTAAGAAAKRKVSSTSAKSPAAAVAKRGTIMAVADLPRLTDRAELLNRLSSAAALRGFSPALQQLSGLSAERQSVEEITRIVKQDPALVARLLGLANSSLYERGGRVDTVHRAIHRIGVTQVRNTALSLQVMDGFGSDLAGGQLKAIAFWEHCIATGLGASELATQLAAPPDECESAFSAGLLHDCGRMALAQTLGDVYGQVLDHARAANVPVELAEAKMLQLTHADAAKVMLSGWGLPESIVTPIALHQHSAEQISQKAGVAAKRVSLLLALADRLAKAANLGDSGNPCLYPLRPFLKALGLEPAKVQSILERVMERMQEMKCLLLSQAPRTQTALAPAWTGPAPLLLDEPSDLDEVGTFCRQMRVDPRLKASAMRPVCIVNLAGNSLSQEMVARLDDHDAAAGMAVPLIAITESATGDLPSDLQQRGNVLRLVAPVRFDVLLETVASAGNAPQAIAA